MLTLADQFRAVMRVAPADGVGRDAPRASRAGRPRATLTADQVAEIRRKAEFKEAEIKRLVRELGNDALAAEYGVDVRTITKVIRRETWRGV